MQEASGSFLRARWVPVFWFHQPSADPNRSASGAEHHAWFQIGEFTNAAGTVFHGDITASMPVTAPRGCSCPASSRYDVRSAGCGAGDVLRSTERARPMVGGMLLSVAVTAFLTGVLSRWNSCSCSLHRCCTSCTPADRYQPVCGNTAGYPCWLLFSAGAIDYALMYNLPAASQKSGCCWLWVLSSSLSTSWCSVGYPHVQPENAGS